MIVIRRSHQRGHADHGWLNTYHTFSFASYYDPKQMGFRALRVINEDRVAAGQGFGTHGHKNMEIVSYVLAGKLEHKDSMGNGAVLQPGEFQRITAGTGILHSEFNPSSVDATHFYQIWLLPEREGLEPGYEQSRFEDAELQNQLRLVASPDAANGSLTIHQDARIYLSRIDTGVALSHSIASRRHAWLQVLKGAVLLDEHLMEAGDGAAISDIPGISIKAQSPAEILLFDLA